MHCSSLTTLWLVFYIMALSKKKRFDVFKRDGFKCVYCGKTPPMIILEVDHINPKSKGGSDDIDNLVTACFDCNRGKAANELSDVPQTIAEKTKVLEEKESQMVEYNKVLNKVEKRLRKECLMVSDRYGEYFDGFYLKDSFLRSSVRRFIKALGVNDVLNAMDVACAKIGWDDQKSINYFCGICWRKMGERHDG